MNNVEWLPDENLNKFIVVKAENVKRDVPTLLEMVGELKFLIKQVDLETCSDEQFKKASEYINWAYMNKLGSSLGEEPEKPDFIVTTV